MRRATGKKVLLRKKPERTKRRDIVPAARSIGTHSLYEEIKKRNGTARVCIIRAVGGIGDVLMTTPTLYQLKREFPNLHLTYAIDRHRPSNDAYYELVKNAPFIDEIIDARYVQRGNYDAVTDISAVCIRYERKGLPSINRIDLFARACGITRLKQKRPFYKVEHSERLTAKYIYRHWRKDGKSIVCLHSASFEGKRSWPGANQLQLIKHAEKHNPKIQFVVFDFNRVLGDISRYTNCYNASDTTVREMAALIAECDLFIGPDSGPMHLAGAIGKASIVLFGSIPPEARINYYPSHEEIRYNGVSCLGCWYAACPIEVRCMTHITGLQVYNQMILKLEEG